MLDKNERLAEMNRLFKVHRQMADERAVAYADDRIGRLGLHNRTFRILGSREYPVLVEEYRVDHRELREFLQIMKHASIEMGQWGKKPEALARLSGKLKAGRQRVAKARERGAEELREAAPAKGAMQPDE